MAVIVTAGAPPQHAPRVRGVDALLVLSTLCAFAAFRLLAMWPQAAPPGSDPGNWLAFGRELFGEDVKAARAAYPPLLPAALWALSRVSDPLLASKLIATVSSVVGGIPVYLVGASAGLGGMALLGTVVFVGAGYIGEVVAFGGYPQLLGEALALTALWLFARSVTERRRGVLLGSALAASLAVGTHHLTAVTLAVTTVLLSLGLIFQGFRTRAVSAGLVQFALLTALLSLPYVPAYLTMARELAGSPMNAQGWARLTAGETFAYIFRNAVGVWYGLIGVAGVSVLLPGRTEPADTRILRALAGASLLAPLLLFTVFAEVRFLQFLFVGLALGLVLGGTTLWAQAGARMRPVVLIVLGTVVAATTWAGVRFTRQAWPWYQIIEPPHLEALEWLKTKTSPEALVAATTGKHGFFLGWWIEGYAGRRTLSGGDPKWMAFRQEKVQTETANAIFDALRSAHPRTRMLVQQAQVSYLVIDRRRWAGVPARALPFPTVFENAGVLILGAE